MLGTTNDLVRRVYQHKNKLTKGFTSEHNVARPVWFEAYDPELSNRTREEIEKVAQGMENKSDRAGQSELG